MGDQVNPIVDFSGVDPDVVEVQLGFCQHLADFIRFVISEVARRLLIVPGLALALLDGHKQRTAQPQQTPHPSQYTRRLRARNVQARLTSLARV